MFRQEKRAQRSVFWVRRPAGGLGVFHAPKVCLPWVSRGGTWNVPGILPGCPGRRGVLKKFCQKKKACAHFSAPRSASGCRKTWFGRRFPTVAEYAHRAVYRCHHKCYPPEVLKNFSANYFCNLLLDNCRDKFQAKPFPYRHL